MSFWVSLVDENDQYKTVESFSEGGTMAIGGCTDADLNITYNYSPFYYKHLNKDEGLRWLDGKTAKETTSKLEHAVLILGTKRVGNYWAATPGNAGFALSMLLSWAKQHPESHWQVN